MRLIRSGLSKVTRPHKRAEVDLSSTEGAKLWPFGGELTHDLLFLLWPHPEKRPRRVSSLRPVSVAEDFLQPGCGVETLTNYRSGRGTRGKLRSEVFPSPTAKG